MVIGELLDIKRAQSLINELRARGVEVQLHSTVIDRETVYQIKVLKPEQAEEAAEYFRVRLGLPGAPPEPDPEWVKLKNIPMGNITKGILLLSVGVFLARFKPELFSKLLNILFFNVPNEPLFSRILEGEVWRLITPIFLHFSFMHITFNSLWIKDLGSLFEKEKGAIHFGSFIFITGVVSNTLQYIAMGRPEFGGLSGVVYALLGFLWVDGQLNPEAEFHLPKRDVVLMVGWYLLCLSGLIGNIANIAHGVGLSAGMFWGLFPWRRGQVKQRLKFITLSLFFGVGTFLIEIARIRFLNMS